MNGTSVDIEGAAAIGRQPGQRPVGTVLNEALGGSGREPDARRDDNGCLGFGGLEILDRFAGIGKQIDGTIFRLGSGRGLLVRPRQRRCISRRGGFDLEMDDRLAQGRVVVLRQPEDETKGRGQHKRRRDPQGRGRKSLKPIPPALPPQWLP